jgi:hypothetical protein
VNQRKADFLQVDPEDMYVAYNLKNEDFIVFSDIRTTEEAEGKLLLFEKIIKLRNRYNVFWVIRMSIHIPHVHSKTKEEVVKKREFV